MNIQVEKNDMNVIKYALKLLHSEYLIDDGNNIFKNCGVIIDERDLIKLRNKFED